MKKIIIKVGTGVLTRESDGQLDGTSLVKLVTAIADISSNGYQVILVSSGAVGAGISGLGLKEYPSDVPTRQACAAVGQTRLMHAYENLFRNFGLSVAQLLLTADDLNDAARSGRVRDTLKKLSEMGNIIPIINENDSVAVEEISVGDNDMLSSRVATLLEVDMLVLMSSIDGLISPETNEVVREIADVNSVLGFVRGDRGKFSIGGMATKLQAVKRSVDAGIETVIMNGSKPERLADVVSGGGLCSRFYTKEI
ncbi:MAG: glutamate 5-kinase [Cryomorphaceae bacterium]|jgi:glutamate 5-kinase